MPPTPMKAVTPPNRHLNLKTIKPVEISVHVHRLSTEAECMGRNMDAVEKIRRALDTRDRIAEHQDHDEFTHHVHAPVVEAVAEMTTVDAAFSQDAKPRYDQLNKALDAKEKMAKNGLRVSAEEELWHEELEEGIQQVAK